MHSSSDYSSEMVVESQRQFGCGSYLWSSSTSKQILEIDQDRFRELEVSSNLMEMRNRWEWIFVTLIEWLKTVSNLIALQILPFKVFYP